MMEAGAEVVKYVSPNEAASGHQGDAANVWRFMIDHVQGHFVGMTGLLLLIAVRRQHLWHRFATL